MIASMTAFARKTEEVNWGSLTWEIRSVNHRYLELTVRLPDFLREIEKEARECLQTQLHRGKVEAVLRFQPGKEVPFSTTVNQTLLEQLAKASEAVLEFFPAAKTDVMDVLSWPGVLQTHELHRDAMHRCVITALQSTVNELVRARQREGEGIKKFLLERLENLHEGARAIEKHAPVYLETMRKKVRTRFDELSLEIDKERLEQEMVWLAQKMDIAEELQRLGAHLSEINRVLNQGGEVGRRLDFLIQELNREANTLGSKSLDADIAQKAVELKVQIEQMREQVQNVE